MNNYTSFGFSKINNISELFNWIIPSFSRHHITVLTHMSFTCYSCVTACNIIFTNFTYASFWWHVNFVIMKCSVTFVSWTHWNPKNWSLSISMAKHHYGARIVLFKKKLFIYTILLTFFASLSFKIPLPRICHLLSHFHKIFFFFFTLKDTTGYIFTTYRYLIK